MKFAPIISGLVGSATVAATIFASSPAHALTWNLNNFLFQDLSTFTNPDTTVTGYFDYDGSTTISNVNLVSTTSGVNTPINVGTVAALPAGNRNYLFGSSSGTFLRLVFASSLPSSVPGLTNISPISSTINGSNAVVSGSVYSVGVPFEVPGGATILAVGSILTLGAIRKIRKSKFTTALID